MVGRFSRDEYLMLFRKDMTAIQEILGDKKYLFGDKITSVRTYNEYVKIAIPKMKKNHIQINIL